MEGATFYETAKPIATASTTYPRVPLGEILSKSEEWIQLDLERTYKQVTVRMWGQGVVQRCEVSGVEVAASRMLVVHANQFIISRIDARKGASGPIPDFLDGAIVTNDFPVFISKSTKILPSFLSWMSKTHRFVDLCKAASEGTTNRVRLKEDRFLSVDDTHAIASYTLDHLRRNTGDKDSSAKDDMLRLTKVASIRSNIASRPFPSNLYTDWRNASS
jgi:hypothetical protein